MKLFNLLKLGRISNFAQKTMASSSVRLEIFNFAFLDLETTGLPSEEHNTTRITELCMTIVESRHISLGVYPRVRNKLNMCFQPYKLINPTSTKITGLANDVLENQSCFSLDVVAAINNFLCLQKTPICLVAHNGNKFDYPILRAEINRVGGSLAQDLLCIDSLVCLQDFHQVKEQEANNEQNDKNTRAAIPIEFSDGYDEILSAAFDDYENSIKKENVQKINERTPKKQIIQRSPIVESKRGISTSPMKKQRLSFKLPDIYRRLTNKDPDNSHHAESDVDCLIHCAAVYGEDFVEWANKNSKLFSEIPPMRPGIRIGS